MSDPIIQELIKQSGIRIRRNFDEAGTSLSDLEKFAELLVRECISTLEEKIYRSIDNEGDEIWADLILKEHFGVEE